MVDFERTYESLKLFGGKKRNEELEILSEKEDDFNFRRLYIDENEKWLHILFSRLKVSRWISISFMFLSIFYLTTSKIFFSLLIISFIFFIISLFFKLKYKIRADKYHFGLKIVNIVIKETYGISL